MGDDDRVNAVETQLGNLKLKVQGDDPEWVSETFDEKLDRMLGEAEEMAKAIRDGTRGCE